MNDIRINIDECDLWITAGIIIGGFTKNWQPLSVIVLITFAISFIRVIGKKD